MIAFQTLRRTSWLSAVAATCLLVALAAGVGSAANRHWRDFAIPNSQWLLDLERNLLMVALGLLAVRLRRWWWRVPFVSGALLQAVVIGDWSGNWIDDVTLAARIRYAEYNFGYNLLFDAYAALVLVAAAIVAALPARPRRPKQAAPGAP